MARKRQTQRKAKENSENQQAVCGDDDKVALSFTLDQALADYNADLPRLQEFILPGGSRSAAIAHVARTICRRAERSVITIGAHEQGAVRPLCQQYLNRLSDLLFGLARTLNRVQGGGDVLWSRER
jgi:cob(I)alamin adenosyltransferase